MTNYSTNPPGMVELKCLLETRVTAETLRGGIREVAWQGPQEAWHLCTNPDRSTQDPKQLSRLVEASCSFHRNFLVTASHLTPGGQHITLGYFALPSTETGDIRQLD